METNYVRAFGGWLYDLSASARYATWYTNEYVQIASATPTAVMFAGVVKKVEEIRAEIARFSTAHEQSLEMSSFEIGRLYQRALDDDERGVTELERIRRDLDYAAIDPRSNASRKGRVSDMYAQGHRGTVPGRDYPLGHLSSGHSISYGNNPDPAAVLTNPPARRPKENLEDLILTNWMSPTQVAGHVLGVMFDYNPVEEVGKFFGGDWTELYRVGSSIEQIGIYLERSSLSLRQAMGAVFLGWEGYEAEAAAVFFRRMERMVDEAGCRAEELAPQFLSLAESVKAQADLVASLFSLILDQVIIVVVSAASAGTGVGPFIGASAALARGARLAKQAWDEMQMVITYVRTFGAAVGVFQAAAIEGTDLPVPVPYDNPTVGN